MFNPADFDALIAQVETKYSVRRVEPLRTAHLTQALFVVRETRRLAESLGMMAAPVRLCQECHAAPAIRLSHLCGACYAIACEEIRAELAQEQAAITDASDDALEIVG